MRPTTTSATLHSLTVEGIWAIADLQRELKCQPNTLHDAIAELVNTGLAHRIGSDFVAPSRAAIVADELEAS